MILPDSQHCIRRYTTYGKTYMTSYKYLPGLKPSWRPVCGNALPLMWRTKIETYYWTCGWNWITADVMDIVRNVLLNVWMELGYRWVVYQTAKGHTHETFVYVPETLWMYKIFHVSLFLYVVYLLINSLLKPNESVG